jgi:hypothetical protein
VLSLSLVAGFEIANASAGQLEGALALAQNDESTEMPQSAGDSTELIGRGRAGGGVRRGGGGVRRGGGGMRRSCGSRSAGVRRGGTSVRRTGGTHRSNGGATHSHAQRSNSRSTHHAQNAHSNNHSNSHANARSHSNSNHQSNHGGHDGRGWDYNGGWDGGVVRVDVDPYIPVVPVVVDPRPGVITLLNPARTGISLNYSLGEAQFVLGSGETATFADGTQVISFDRGDSFGEARYTLPPGNTYQFVSTDHGWDLHSVTGQVGGDAVADNATDHTVSEGSTQTNGAGALALLAGK